MSTLMGGTESVAAAPPIGICFTSTCGFSPTRLEASRSLPVICQSVDVPARRTPITFQTEGLSRFRRIDHPESQVFLVGAQRSHHVERIRRAAGVGAWLVAPRRIPRRGLRRTS